jgi:hypothetical protein
MRSSVPEPGALAQPTFDSDAILQLSFLEPHFKKIQDNIPTITAHEKLKDFTLRRKAYAASLKPLLSLLAKEIQTKNPTFDLSPKIAWEILRRKHIDFLTRYFVEHFPLGITKQFKDKYLDRNSIPVIGTEFESTQTPVDVYRNCYYRWGAGLAAFRKHTLKIAGSREPLLEIYHHASPVPYEEVNFTKRLEATTQNLDSLAQHLGNPPSFTEIRLLSPGNPFVNDDQQILETFFAAIRSEKHISLFVYGINIARLHETALQTRINNRATSQLFEKIFKQLKVPCTVTEIQNDDNQKQYDAVLHHEQERQEFDDAVRAIDLTDGKKASAKFSAVIKEQDSNELSNLEIYRHKWERFLTTAPKEVIQSGIVQTFNRFLQLKRKTTSVIKNKYNGQIQAILIELNRLLSEPVCIGCNDAKDRDGMVSIAAEALTIFYQRYKRYPYPFPLPHQELTEMQRRDYTLRRRADLQALLHIQQTVCVESTPIAIAEAVSWPLLAHGLAGTAQYFSGYQHLPNEESAGIFKEVYGTLPHPLQRSNKLINGIAQQLINAQENGDKNKISQIKLSLKLDPLFADIRQLPQYKKLNVLERHPLLRKALIGIGIGIVLVAGMTLLGAIIMYTGGFWPLIIGKAALLGLKVGSLFGLNLTHMAASITGIVTIAVSSLFGASFFGAIAGVIAGIVKRYHRLDLTPLFSKSANAILAPSPTSTKNTLIKLKPGLANAAVAVSIAAPVTVAATVPAAPPNPTLKPDVAAEEEEELSSEDELSSESNSGSEEDEESLSADELVDRYISPMTKF